MDRCKVATACVSHLLAVGPDARAGNELLLTELAQHPGRLLGYCVFARTPPRSRGTGAAGDLLEVPGVIGVKLHPEVHELPLDHPAYAPAFDIAAERGRIVLAHGQHASSFSDPVRFAAVAPRYPELPLLMGHSGLWTSGFAPAAEAASRCPI